MFRNHFATAVWLVLSTLCVTAISCTTLTDHNGTINGTLPATETGNSTLPTLAEMPKNATALGGYVRLGRQLDAAIPPNLVTPETDQARFSPAGSVTLDEAAYQGYLFSLADETGALQLEFEWATAPAIDAETPLFWIGLSNWQTGSWQWFVPDDSAAMNIADIAPFIQAVTGNFYVVVLTSGTNEAVLNELGFPSLTPPDTGPRIESVTPTSGAPGAQITFITEYFSLNPFEVSWSFGEGITPPTSTELAPTITLGVVGTYACSVSVTNDDGNDEFNFDFDVRDPYYFGCGRLGTESSPESGVTINLTGDATASVASDSDGEFVFKGLDNGNYTATPDSSEFTPDYIDFTIDNSFQTQLYFQVWDGFIRHDIIGEIVTDNGGQILHGVVELTGDATQTSNDSVIFENLADGNYRVTPAEPGYYFVPEYRDVTISNTDVTEVSFRASESPINAFTISGTVTEADTGEPAAGVLMEIYLTWDEFAVTDENGYYEFPNAPSTFFNWALVDYVPRIAATFEPRYGYTIHDEANTSGKDFVMTIVE